MFTPKLIFIGIIILAFLIFLASVAIYPYTLFQEEFGWIPSIVQWDIYFVTVFVPLSFLFGLFFNGAGRAINPRTKRFVNTASIIIIQAIVAALWFYLTNAILIPDLEIYFYTNLSVSFSSDISFLLLSVLSVFGLPLLCVSIAAPVNTHMALKSLCRWFR